MKKSRHSEEKRIAAVRQMEGGRKTAEVARELAERCGMPKPYRRVVVTERE